VAIIGRIFEPCASRRDGHPCIAKPELMRFDDNKPSSRATMPGQLAKPHSIPNRTLCCDYRAQVMDFSMILRITKIAWPVEWIDPGQNSDAGEATANTIVEPTRSAKDAQALATQDSLLKIRGYARAEPLVSP
jgi:hypothetical protein